MFECMCNILNKLANADYCYNHSYTSSEGDHHLYNLDNIRDTPMMIVAMRAKGVAYFSWQICAGYSKTR